MKERFGVENVFQLDSVKRKRVQALRESKGDDWQAQLVKQKNRTVRKRYGVDCVLELDSIREKCTSTMVKRYGVTSAMQNPTIFLKALAKSRHIHDIRISGRKFRVQGKSEIQVAMRLCEVYGADYVHSQFHKKYPDYAYAELGTFPDFYIDTIDTFVECKSSWTFMGRGGKGGARAEGDLEANKIKARNASDSGNKIRWVIHHHDRKLGTHSFLKLRADWFNMSSVSLRKLVTEFLKGESP